MIEPQAPPPSNTVVIRQWIVAAIALLVIMLLLRHLQDRVPSPAPGILVQETPQQILINNGKPFAFKSYNITPIATFTIRARVLSVAYYHSEPADELSPVDFAVGWGIMSDSAVLDKLSVSQDGRWYYINFSGEPPIRTDWMILHSHNIHIIPATDAVAEIIMQVRKNEIINMDGYLVAVTGPDGFNWVSSLTMDRQGPHTCKLYFVNKIRIEPHA